MKRIITVLGARPQFIKAAALSRVLRSSPFSDVIEEVIVHTGQHYDENMSDVFFREMDIPQPDFRLEIGGTSHGRMTGQMLIELEDLYLQVKPDAVLVYGDTNTTLAGALAASKLNIPIAHVEAGLRSFWKRMPEEQNRVLTDHLSTWLFCPTDASIQNLKAEGIQEGIHRVGDVMYDINLFYQARLQEEAQRGLHRPTNEALAFQEPFVLMTVHRAENTDASERLINILKGAGRLPLQIIWPVHPRTAQVIRNMGLQISPNIHLIPPLGYLDMLSLEMRAELILTDSGGVQKEAYFLQKPCITLRDQTEWIETVEDGWNKLGGTLPESIWAAYQAFKQAPPAKQKKHYGEGDAARKIAEVLMQDLVYIER